jgi:butyrate kinase
MPSEVPLIIANNDGGGSTKLAAHQGDTLDPSQIVVREIQYSPEELIQLQGLKQLPLRTTRVKAELEQMGINPDSISAVVARGGPVRPLAGGVYYITTDLINGIRGGKDVQTWHPSLLSPLIACEIATSPQTLRLMTADVSVDELLPEARITGVPGLERRALSHAFSCRSVAIEAAHDLGKPYEQCRLVVLHLGTGITVAAHLNGKQVDSSDANGDSPFASQRAGALPTEPLIKLCFSGKPQEEILGLIRSKGGLLAHLGTDNLLKVEQWMDGGNDQAKRIWNALAFHIIKAIGAYAGVLHGNIDAIVITGGMAKSQALCDAIKKATRWITGNFFFYPGERETEFMIKAGLRVHHHQEEALPY